MNALPLFDAATHVRRTDPSTSKAAARKAEGLAASHQRAILGCLEAFHPTSLTYRDIAKWTGLEPVAVNRRLKELHDAGLILLTGMAIMDNGNEGRTWRAAK